MVLAFVMITEPSPTGRDEAGLRSRKVTLTRTVGAASGTGSV